MGKCFVVTVVDCDHEDWNKEAPDGCLECGMLDWMCFETIEEANSAWLKMNKLENNLPLNEK